MFLSNSKTLTGHTSYVWSVFAIDNIILSGSDDNTVKIWDRTSHTCTATLTGHTSAVISVFAIDNIILSGSWDNTIKIWDRTTFKCIKTINEVKVLSVFATKSMILAAKLNGSIKTFDYITNKQAFTALMCMWKLGYPNEIIHEIFKWLGINTYA